MPPRPADSPDTLAALVRERLASGRAMDALKKAKDLAKRHPGPEADDLLAQAYRARIAELAQRGMHAEAQELLAVAAARFPDAADSWEAAAKGAARAAGNLDDLLVAWRDARGEDERAEVARELAQSVRDLRAVAASPVLPQDDPLRAAAETLHADFVAAASGELGEDRREALARRDVPAALHAWRHFALAVDAFHREHDGAARHALAAIDDASALAPGKRILLDLLDGNPLQRATPAARALAQRLCDNTLGARGALATLRAPEASAAARRAAAREMLLELARRQPRAALRFVWWLRGDRTHDALVHELDGSLGHALFGEEWLRQTADLDAEEDPVLGTTTWLTWLMPQAKGDALRRLGDLELATLLQHLVPIAVGAEQTVEERLGADVVRALGHPSRLRELLRPFEDEEHADATEYAITCWSTLAEACRRLRQRTGVVPRLHGAWQLAEFALALDPVADRFALVADCLGVHEQDLLATVLEEWAQRLPADVEPLLRMVELHESSGAMENAAAILARAAALAPDSESVGHARLRLQLDEVRRHALAGELSAARILLEDLTHGPSARLETGRVLLAAARHALGSDDASALAAAVPDPTVARAALDVARAMFLGEEPDAPPRMRPKEALLRAAWLGRLAEFARDAALPAVLPEGRIGRHDVPADVRDRLALCRLAKDAEDWELIEIVSGAALLQEGPPLGRLVLHRAVALGKLGDGHHLVQDLLAVARFLAEREGDGDTLRAARALRAPLADEFDEATVLAVLAEERAHERRQSAVIADHARPLTPREHQLRRRSHPPRHERSGGEGESRTEGDGP